MSIQMNEMDAGALAIELKRAFANVVRPKSLFNMSADFRKLRSEQVQALEDFDWVHGNPDQIDVVYDVATFISKEGYRYLLPRVFEFCVRWGEEATSLSFVNSFFILLKVEDSLSEWFADYSPAEKEITLRVIGTVYELFDILVEDMSDPFDALFAAELESALSV